MTRAGYQAGRGPSRQGSQSRSTRSAGRKRNDPRPRPPVLRSSMAMRRSTQMLILGLAIFAIGAGVVLVSFGGSGGGSGKAAVSTTTTTVQAGTVVVNATAAAAPASFTIPEGKQAVAVQV